MSPTSCRVSEKLLERFPKTNRNTRTNGRTNGGDSIGPFGFQPGTNITRLENNTIATFNNFVIFCSDKFSDLISPKIAKKWSNMFFSKYFKSKTPLITLIKQLNFCCWICIILVLILLFEHFWKKKKLKKKKKLTSVLTSIFGLTSIFFWRHMLKNSKKCNF